MEQFVKFKWQVSWETLNGNVNKKRFTNAVDADEFYKRKQETAVIYGIQWVDIDQIST